MTSGTLGNAKFTARGSAKMNAETSLAPHWDPYNQSYFANPYPAFRRLRERAPLYYNDEYDFYAVSHFDDCMNVLGDRDTYVSRLGGVLEFMKNDTPVPSGMIIYEDAPIHTVHRGLLTRVFTPKRVAALDDDIRKFCARALDPFKDHPEGFDFITHLGSEMPMRVIGMLLGMPEDSLKEAQRRVDENMRTEPGKPLEASGAGFTDQAYAEFVDWKTQNPGDDLMSELIHSEYKDVDGEMKKLTRVEILTLISLLFGAGNETTNRTIGWTAKLLSEHPDQRKQVHEDRALIPQVIEEVLRYESPGPYIGRVNIHDVELHGVQIPARSPVLAIVASANRDESKFENGDSFNIRRERHPHLTFGYGFHNCLGNALARVEARIALDEILNRFPNWTVDMTKAKMSSTATVRGWETLPAHLDKH
jgi:cytochrome P450